MGVHDEIPFKSMSFPNLKYLSSYPETFPLFTRSARSFKVSASLIIKGFSSVPLLNESTSSHAA